MLQVIYATKPFLLYWADVPVYEAFGLPVERQSAGCK
jgi:hypothetical protein